MSNRVVFFGSDNYKYFVLFMLGLVAAVNFIDRAIFSVLAVSIKDDLQLSDTQIGLVGGVGFALFYAIIGLPLARLADKTNRITLLSLCLSFWSLATAACGFVTNFWQLLAARVAVGAGEAGCFPASFSVLSDYFKPSKRAFAIGLFYFAGFIGFTFGLAFTGALAESIGWRQTFVVVGLPGILLAIGLKLLVKEPKRTTGDDLQDSSQDGLVLVIKKLVKKRSYIHLVLGYTFFIFSSYAMMLWLPQFYNRVHGLDSSEIGLYFGMALGLGLVTGSFLGAILSNKLIARSRVWEMRFPALVSIMAFIVFGIVLMVPSLTLSLFACFFGGIASTAGLGPNFAAIQSLTEPQHRATSSAFVLFVSAIVGQGFGPTLAGVFSDVLNNTDLAHPLKISLLIVSIPFLFSAIHNHLGSKSFLSDLDK
ncbi:MAG: putative MFS family arabinose efflux permease [Glaciecola sp.]